MTFDPFHPILIGAWLIAAGLAGYAFTQAPPAQIEAPEQSSVVEP